MNEKLAKRIRKNLKCTERTEPKQKEDATKKPSLSTVATPKEWGYKSTEARTKYRRAKKDITPEIKQKMLEVEQEFRNRGR